MSILSKLAFWRGTTPTLPVDPLERSEPAVVLLRTGHGKPVRTTWSTEKAIAEGYKISSWAYTAMTKRAEQAMAAPPVLQALGKDGRWTAVERVPSGAEWATDLFNRPNPEHTWSDLIVLASLGLDLSGNALQTVILGAGRTREVPVALWTVPPDAISPIVPERDSADRFVTQYKIMQGSKRGRYIDAEAVIHARNPDPSNHYWGFGRLQAAGVAIDTDIEAAQTNRSVMSQAVSPSGVLGIEESGMSPDELEALAKQFNDKYGTSEARGKVPIFQGKTTFTPFSISPEKLLLIASRKFSREEIDGVFGLPPILGGDYANSSYNNISQALRIFWILEIIPLLGRYYGALNHRLASYLPSNHRIWFSTDGLDFLHDISPEQVTAAKDLWTMGVEVGELNRRFGWGLNPDKLNANNNNSGGRS